MPTLGVPDRYYRPPRGQRPDVLGCDPPDDGAADRRILVAKNGADNGNIARGNIGMTRLHGSGDAARRFGDDLAPALDGLAQHAIRRESSNVLPAMYRSIAATASRMCSR
jgi:hypothetical protein